MALNPVRNCDTYIYQIWGEFGNSGIAYFKKMELESINFELELKFAINKLNPQINLPFIF